MSCFIIAEIGINHNGDINLARKTIEAAKNCGVDAVKFQSYSTDDFLSDEKLMYSYYENNTKITESQYDLFKRNELSNQDLWNIKQCCDSFEIEFISTPTSSRGVETLVELGCKSVKNGSDFLVNHKLVQAMARSGLRTILSTGMATVAEIDDAVSAYRAAGGLDLVLLHCTSNYPTAPHDMNLRRIPVLADVFGCPSGLSDHSEGISASIAAVVLGATIIEKHFTLDRSLPGPDHRFSCDPYQMMQLVDAVRTAEASLGEAKLGPTKSEMLSRDSFRLSCVASEDIQSGTVINSSHIAFKRPGHGIPPKYEDALLGRTLKLPLSRGDIFHWDCFI